MNDDNDEYHDADEQQHDEHESNELLDELWTQVRLLAAGHGAMAQHRVAAAAAANCNVDAATARTLLQVTQGNVREAAQLYWDDFLARRHQQEEQDHQDEHDESDHHNDNDDSDDDEDEDEDDHNNHNHNAHNHNAAIAGDADDDDEPAPEINGDAAAARGLRRRLIDRLAAAAHAEDEEQHEQQNDPSDDDDDDDNNDNDHNNHNPRQRRVIEERSTVNVSDDEGVWRWRTRSGQQRRRRRDGKDDDKNPSSAKKRKLATAASTNDDENNDSGGCGDFKNKDDDFDNNDIDGDDDGYLSEHDWIWDAISDEQGDGLDANLLSDPTDLLWGLGPTAAAGPPQEQHEETGVAAAAAATAAVSKGVAVGAEAAASSAGAADEEEKKKQANNSDNKKDDDNDDSNKSSKKSDGKAEGEKEKMSILDYIVKDADVPSNETEEEDDEDYEPPGGIPRTWMNAGFHIVLSKNDDDDHDKYDDPIVDETKKNAMPVVGLALREPHEDDMAYFCHKQLVQNDSSQKVPPPYHCRGITALLSVVTALLYTGASVQGNHVSCASTTRPPILDVVAEHMERVEKQKKKKKASGSTDKNNDESTSSTIPPALSARELESRLVDALSALLVLAATASIERKRRALQSLQHSKDPDDQRKWQKLQRKLNLVPTCWWETDNAGDVRLPETNDDDGRTCSVQVTTSLTHVQDLRSYCVSNLKAFTGSGGCALFLETILRIHGRGAVRRMVRRARATAGISTTNENERLVHCACDHHHHERMVSDKAHAKKLKAAAKKNDALDTTPRRGDDCVSTELLSLLLTGRVHATLRGWSTGSALGVGVLTDRPGAVSRGLTRPEKPVWILRGPTCYSVMVLTGCSDHADTFARVDHDGMVAALTHWNPWYGSGGGGRERHGATHFRLAADRCSGWKPSPPVCSSSASSSDDDDNNNDDYYCDDDNNGAQFEREIAPLSRSLQTLARSRRQQRARAVQQHRVERVDPALYVTPQEMDRVRAHPDDPQFYPNQHRLWRYHLRGDNDGDGEDDSKNNNAAKQPPQQPPQWRPFFSLSDREKLVVETKLGPKIAPILWTRWPRAVVDRFVPADPAPMV